MLGLSLSGATHVLALEQTVVELLSRVDALEAQLDLQARRMHQEVSAVHRRYRRDLVPYTPAKHPLRWTSRS